MRFETEIELDEDTLVDIAWELEPSEAITLLVEIGERFDIDFSNAIRILKSKKRNDDNYISDFY